MSENNETIDQNASSGEQLDAMNARQQPTGQANQLQNSPFGLILAEMLQRMDELQLAYRNLGRSENHQFLDLVTARLMNNPVFFERLAITIINTSKAMQSHFISNDEASARIRATKEAATNAASDEEGPETIVAVATTVGELGDAIVQQNEDGGTTKMWPQNQINTKSAFFPFEGHTHRLLIKMGMNESKELAIVGGTVWYGDVTEKLNPNTDQGRALLTSINASMRTLIEQGKETPDMFSDARLAYFAMNVVTASEVAPQVDTLEA